MKIISFWELSQDSLSYIHFPCFFLNIGNYSTYSVWPRNKLNREAAFMNHFTVPLKRTFHILMSSKIWKRHKWYFKLSPNFRFIALLLISLISGYYLKLEENTSSHKLIFNVLSLCPRFQRFEVGIVSWEHNPNSPNHNSTL